jgi:hypothetical protein
MAGSDCTLALLVADRASATHRRVLLDVLVRETTGSKDFVKPLVDVHSIVASDALYFRCACNLLHHVLQDMNVVFPLFSSPASIGFA